MVKRSKKIVTFEPCTFYDTQRYFNVDLSYPCVRRFDISVRFPWDIELENKHRYPILASTALGGARIAILQSETNSLRILVEFSIKEVRVPKAKYAVLKEFNETITPLMAHSVVVRRTSRN